MTLAAAPVLPAVIATPVPDWHQNRPIQMQTLRRQRATTARNTLFATLATAALTLLSACAGTDVLAPGGERLKLQATRQAPLTVRAQQSGTAIELAVGQELVVRLATQSTSGHEWALVDLAPGVLSSSGPTFERDQRTASVEEASGEAIWRLRSVRPGTVLLNFEYRRPRDLAPAEQRATYSVTVR